VGKKIYVGNLAYSVRDQELAEKFGQFGTVESAKVVMDRDTGRSKGFGFVEMSSPEEAADAISSLHGTEFNGRNLTVSEAKPMAPREGGGGFSRGPRGGGDRGDRGGDRGGRRDGGNRY
jgi:RNA recognition motif-containing protein